MDRHMDIINKYKKKLLKRKHVVGVGFGIKETDGKRTGERAVVVLVDKKIKPDKLKRKDMVPQSLEGYQTDVIEIGRPVLQVVRTERTRPAQPGISIGHYKISAGTMGAIVKDKQSNEPLILSNNHVLANITNGRDGRAEIGDHILQPGSYDDGAAPDDIIGTLERFIPIRKGASNPQCSVAISAERIFNFFLRMVKPSYRIKVVKQEGGNLVDCAVAKPVRPDLISENILEIGKIKGIKEAEVGMRVQKSGRTSGLTRGEIKAVGVTVEVGLNENEAAVFDDQIITTPISKAGDSGSLVLDMNNNAVGLLFAGSDKATVCSRIQNVLDLLKVKL